MNIEVARQRVNEVIQVDTNTNSESDFLATHVPFRQIKIKNGGGKIDEFKDISEEEVFNQYIKNPGNRHQFIIVQGASGSGKSHLIRWFASKFNTFKHENETVIYIRRSDNSLKGTIRQLLDLDEIKNLPNREIYKRLSDAGSSISSNELKNTIYYHLIAKVKSDTKYLGFSRIENTKLIALLSNQDFMDYFLNEPGFDKPIDRIYRKVAPSNKLKGINDKPARFESADFELNSDFILEMRNNGADSKAIRLAEKLVDFDSVNANPMREKIAVYLNQFVDSVIQEIAGLQPGDFENVFSEIRRELYRKGKNLTLLIEDITSFTGVNQALLNVLTDTHTGTALVADKQMCRLSSVVGTTTEYYNEFRDNFANRISQEIYIKDDALTSESNSNSLIEFIAKYLNAMSLTNQEIIDWVNRGAQLDSFPVSTSTEPSFWEKYELDNTHFLSLYPLNQSSILNLTKSLGEGRKTPRYILTDVIRRVVQNVLKDVKKFPSFSIKADLLNGMDIRERNYMSNQVENEDDQKRLLELMCVWGNSTIKDQIDDVGKRYLAGIRYEIYETFGFHDIHGQDSGKINAVQSENKSNDKLETLKTITQKSAVEKNIENNELKNLSNMLGAWEHGEQFKDGRNEIRGALDNFVFSGIDWQIAGISLENINLVRKYGFITVENLNRGNATGLYTIPANATSTLVINASERWRILGKKSWDYDGSDEDMYYLTKWIHDITPKMIELVKNYLNGNKNRVEELALACAAYCSLLNGRQLRINDATNFLLDIRSNKFTEVIEGVHSIEWQQLQNKLMRNPDFSNIIQLAGNYFNIKQDIGTSTNLFLNRVAYDSVFNKLVRNNKMVVENIEEMLDVNNDIILERRKIAKNYKSVIDVLHSIIEAEDQFGQLIAAEICSAFEINSIGELDHESLNEFFEETKEYMAAVEKADLLTCISDIDVTNLKKLRDNRDCIYTASQQLGKGLDASSDFKKLVQYSKNPCGTLQPFKQLIEEIKQSISCFKVQSTPNSNHDDKESISVLEENKSEILNQTVDIGEKLKELEEKIHAQCGII